MPLPGGFGTKDHRMNLLDHLPVFDGDGIRIGQFDSIRIPHEEAGLLAHEQPWPPDHRLIERIGGRGIGNGRVGELTHQTVAGGLVRVEEIRTGVFERPIYRVERVLEVDAGIVA